MGSCKQCKHCKSISNIYIFISVGFAILALLYYFNKTKLTENFEDNNWQTERNKNELIYTYNGSEIMRLTKNGDVTVKGTLTVGELVQTKKKKK